MKSIIYSLILFSSTILLSCTDNKLDVIEPIQKEVGYITMDIFTDQSTIDQSPAALSAIGTRNTEVIYQIDIFDSSNAQNPVLSYDNHNAMPAKIELPHGNYAIKALHGLSGDIGINKPLYSGSSEFIIDNYITKAITITTSLQNVKISSVLDKNITDNFSFYELTITQGIKSFKITDFTSCGYINPSEDFTWTLNLTNNQGEKFTLTDTQKAPQAREHYNLMFSVRPVAPNSGAAGFILSVSNNLDSKTHEVDVKL